MFYLFEHENHLFSLYFLDNYDIFRLEHVGAAIRMKLMDIQRHCSICLFPYSIRLNGLNIQDSVEDFTEKFASNNHVLRGRFV